MRIKSSLCPGLPEAANDESGFSHANATFSTAGPDKIYCISTERDEFATLHLRLGNGRCGRFLADTGATVNVIKETIAKNLPYRRKTCRLQGIHPGEIIIDKEAKIDIENREHVFVIVSDTFPIEADGIIGMPFLQKERAIIDTCSKKIVFRREPRPKNILHIKIDPDRSRLLRENTRLNHILDEKAREDLWNIINQYQNLFYLDGDTLPCTDLTEHKIETSDDKPINVKQYRYPPAHQEEIQRQVADMLEKEIISDSTSPYNSPLWVVPKKSDASGKKKWRIVVDFRQLNSKTDQDAYPLPNVEEILDQLGRARYFSALDLASGFHQIPMEKNSRKKTAFSTPNGHYEFLRMPFGLKNAPATFQRMMDRVLRGLIGKVCFVYLDDIVVYGENLEEHNAKLKIVLERLLQLNLKIQSDKCEYLKPELQYLGHVITDKGVRPNPEKLKAVQEFPLPKNAKNIKQFLGLTGYYRRFIRDFSKKAKPLTILLKKDAVFNFGTDQQAAFEILKNELCSEPLLQYPDFSQEFILTTDASNDAIGAILSQGKLGRDKPVAYASRTLDAAERNYSVTEKELLAIKWATKHFRPYLYGRKFKIMTDHQPLKWLMNVKDPSSRLMRWRIALEEYEYEIIYKRGNQNGNADALSRNPVLMIEGAPLQKWGKNLEFVLEVPETAIPVYVSHADKSGILYNNDEDLANIIIQLTGRENLEDYRNYLEEIRNFIIAHELGELAIDVADLQRIFPGQTTKLKSIIQELFIGSDIKVYLRAKPIKIPETPEEIQSILRESHNTAIGGHGGYKRTLRRIVVNYQWPNMYHDILNYVKCCQECQRQKVNRKPTKMPLCITDTPECFNEKVAMDVVGPLTESDKGNKYILTIQDQLTKYLMARPMRDQKASTIIETFVKSYIGTFGPPKNILTDNGTNFTGQLMKELNDWMKMKHITTTAFHPESNGSLERSHQVIKEYLKTTCEDTDSWDDYVEMACYSYNSAIHETTGYTPHELVFGTKPRNLTSTDRLSGKTYSEYLEELKRKTERITTAAKEIIIRAKERVKERYDRFCRMVEFRPGDFVWITRETRDKSSGLYVPYEGPYEVIDKIGDVNYKIRKNNKDVVMHANRLKYANMNLFQGDAGPSGPE